MNLKSNAAKVLGGVAIAATLTAAVAGSPVQAATIAAGSTLNLSQFNPGAGVTISPTQLNFFGPGLTPSLTLGSAYNATGTGNNLTGGAGGVTIGASTGSFANYSLGAGLIKDLALPTPAAGQKSNFLQFAVGSIRTTSTFPFVSFPTWTGRFNLDTFTVTSAANQPFAANFTGFFNVQGFDLTPGIGQLTAQNLSGTTSYSLSITAVPTPALLPGLLGLGVAALRKRKSEQTQVGSKA
jgi:hypothetical protein